MHEIFAYAISALLGGGLFKGIEALVSAFSNAKEKNALADAVGAKTPAEIESVSIVTMTKALESAGKRIESLEAEREIDKKYYQDRIKELTDQLHRVRVELSEMEGKFAELLNEINSTNPEHREV